MARTMDSDRAHLTDVLRRAAAHRGTALVEIYQNCPIFNDGPFDVLKDREQSAARLIHLRQGEPITIGDAEVLVRRADGGIDVVPTGSVDSDQVLRHDAHNADPSQQFALSRLDDPTLARVPVGVFREVSRPTYDDLVRSQITQAQDRAGGPATDADLAGLLAGHDTWTVEA